MLFSKNGSLAARILTVTMYFCIIAIPLAFYLVTYDSCMIKITILQIGGALILASWLFRALAEGRLNKQRLLWDLPVVLYFSWSIFSYLQSPYKFSSTVDDLIRLVYYVGIYLAASDFFSQDGKIKTIANLLLATVAVAIIYGFLQFTGLEYSFLSLREIFSAGLAQNLSLGHIEEVFVSLIHLTFGNPGFYLFLLGLLAVFVGYRFKQLKNDRSLGYLTVIALLLSAVYILFAYFRGDPFAWGGAFGTRVFSTFGNPNFYAAFLVLTAPLILAFIFKTRSQVNRVLFSLLFLTDIISLFVTGSKGGWLGIAGALFFFSLFMIKYAITDRRVKTYLAVFTLLALLVSVLGVYQYSRKREDSIRFRLLTWRSTIEMIKLHPIIGNGLGSFRLIYPAYRDKEIFRIEGRHQTETQHPENEYLEIANDEGIVGILLFLWLVWTVLRRGLARLDEYKARADLPIKSNKTAPPPPSYQVYYLAGFMAGWLGLLSHNLFCVNLRFVSSGFFLWLFLGVINGARPDDACAPTQPRPTSLASRGGSGLLKTMIIILTALSIVLYARFFLADDHHNIGIYYSKMHAWDDAIAEYEASIRLNPFFVMSRYFLGNVYNDRWQQGDDQRALEKYDEVIKMAPNYVMVHYQRGIVYMKTQKYRESVEEFQQALQLDPVYPQTYFRLGLIYINTQQLDKALDNFAQAARLEPNSADIHVSLANVYFMQHKLDIAEKEYLQAVKLDQYNINAHRNLGLLYLRLNRRVEARRELEITRQAIPDDPEVNRVLKGLEP